MSFAAAYGLGRRLVPALLLGLITTVLEALPLRDIDNIIVPLGAGWAALFLWG